MNVPDRQGEEKATQKRGTFRRVGVSAHGAHLPQDTGTTFSILASGGPLTPEN